MLQYKELKIFWKIKPTYKPGVTFANLNEILPVFVSDTLKEGLTELEKEEQQILRRRYIDSYKANLRAQLEGVELKNKKK